MSSPHYTLSFAPIWQATLAIASPSWAFAMSSIWRSSSASPGSSIAIRVSASSWRRMAADRQQSGDQRGGIMTADADLADDRASSAGGWRRGSGRSGDCLRRRRAAAPRACEGTLGPSPREQRVEPFAKRLAIMVADIGVLDRVGMREQPRLERRAPSGVASGPAATSCAHNRSTSGWASASRAVNPRLARADDVVGILPGGQGWQRPG